MRWTGGPFLFLSDATAPTTATSIVLRPPLYLNELASVPHLDEYIASQGTVTMAIISAKTIITSLSLFHVTLAYFFLTNPATIADQAMVYVLGESMGMASLQSFTSWSIRNKVER